VVLTSNEPTVLTEGDFASLSEFANLTYADIDGTGQPFLRPHEVQQLSIRKGSLDEGERQEIESHVNHTFDFLRRIPWTKGLSQVPQIAWAPQKLTGRVSPPGPAPSIPCRRG
jgi:hypothetical protein